MMALAALNTMVSPHLCANISDVDEIPQIFSSTMKALEKLHMVYHIVLNKCSCLNKCALALSGTRIGEKWVKMGKNGRKTCVLFLQASWTHLGVCLHTGSVCSALYGNRMMGYALSFCILNLWM